MVARPYEGIRTIVEIGTGHINFLRPVDVNVLSENLSTVEKK
jgi:hypothetical protein